MEVKSGEKSNVWIDEIIENVQELKLSRMSLEFFSIHIWLMLLREYTLSQSDCRPSLTADKILSQL